MELLTNNNTFELKLTKKSNMILNVLFALSLISLNVLLCITGSAKWMALSIVVSIIVFIVLIFKKNFLQDKLKCKSKALGLTSLLFTLISDIYFIMFFYQQRYERFVKIAEKSNISLEQLLMFGKIGTVILGIISLLALFILWNYVFNKYFDSIKRFIFGFDKLEKNFMIVTAVIFTLAVTIIYLKTNVFYGPTFNNKLSFYDVVYTSDTGSQVISNVFMNIGHSENDLRQPLFGLYALPFGIVSVILSKIFFFIPNSYALALAIVQFLVIDIAIICIARMLKLEKIEKVLFLIINICSYPFLLFSLNMEQYVFAVFWMILFIYAVVEDKSYRDILYIGATGSMLTSGVLFVMLSKSRELKQYIKDIAAVAVKFFMIVIIVSRLPAFLYASDSMKMYGTFVGEELTFYDKVLQYINFMATCLVKPESCIKILEDNDYVSYFLTEATKVNLFGIVVLVLCILGFALNYKNKFARLCMIWVLYSFLLLCLVGWGTSENGLVLYSFYFSWAFISLIYLLINKIFEKVPKVKIVCLCALIVALAVVNIPGILDLINFGILYYPAI